MYIALKMKMNSDTPSPVMIRLKTHEQFLIALHAVSTVLKVLLRQPLPPPSCSRYLDNGLVKKRFHNRQDIKISCLVPMPHYYARPMRFGSRGPRKFLRPSPGRSSRIRHRNALTERAWRDVVSLAAVFSIVTQRSSPQGLGKLISMWCANSN